MKCSKRALNKLKTRLFTVWFLVLVHLVQFLQKADLTKEGERDDRYESQQEGHADFIVFLLLTDCLRTT